MPKGWYAVLIRCLLLALSIGCWAYESGTSIGAVVEIEGEWRIDGHSELLLKGQGVPSGASVKADPNVGHQSISVVLANKTVLKASCSDIPCIAALSMPQSIVDTDPSFQKIWKAVSLVLFNQDPHLARAYESTSIRGGKAPRTETIVGFNAAKMIELPVPDEAYRFLATKISDGSTTSDRSVSSAHSRPTIEIALPAAGAYLVSFTDRFHEEVSNILVIVAEPASVDLLQASYKAVQEACADWDANARDFFTRAYLISLTERR